MANLSGSISKFLSPISIKQLEFRLQRCRSTLHACGHGSIQAALSVSASKDGLPPVRLCNQLIHTVFEFVSSQLILTIVYLAASKEKFEKGFKSTTASDHHSDIQR